MSHKPDTHSRPIPMPLQSYLLERNGRFYLNMRVPTDLRHLYGKEKIIRKSLHTSARLEALSCSVYTSYLDHIQAAWLNKNQPPQILYSYLALDGRHPLFEGSEFSYHVLRQYAVVANTDTYAAMRRKAGPEPQIERQDSTQPGHFDQEIVLPQADANHYLLLKVKMRRSFLGEVIGLIYKKTTSPQIVFHLKDGASYSHRFVHDTGQDGLLVSHCVESMDQYVRLNKMDWAPNVRSISFGIDGYSGWQFADSFQLQFGTSIISK